MTEIEKIVLLGLKKYGKTKRIADILDEANIPHTPAMKLDAAVALEAKGLIQNVIYRLPLHITAELTSEGHRVADGLNHGTSGGISNVAEMLIVAQMIKQVALDHVQVLML